jgi:hypothetical protein
MSDYKEEERDGVLWCQPHPYSMWRPVGASTLLRRLNRLIEGNKLKSENIYELTCKIEDLNRYIAELKTKFLKIRK